jgi:hypothetical protein
MMDKGLLFTESLMVTGDLGASLRRWVGFMGHGHASLPRMAALHP